MEKVGSTPDDYDHVVFHQPNGKFPRKVAQILGFTSEQIFNGMIVPYIGNTYSGASCIGLAAVLDVSKPGERILVVSYGSGAGSDGFDITVSGDISTYHKSKAATIMEMVDDKRYISYGEYAKDTNLLIWE
jgi:hydroxymethylglutaryl-CoA synthase